MGSTNDACQLLVLPELDLIIPRAEGHGIFLEYLISPGSHPISIFTDTALDVLV